MKWRSENARKVDCRTHNGPQRGERDGGEAPKFATHQSPEWNKGVGMTGVTLGMGVREAKGSSQGRA